jgi:hypothetical protein
MVERVMPPASALIVRRDDLLDCRIVELEKTALGAGEVELSVDRFAFTANNVTYGSMGEAFSYWNFFPTGVEGYGCIPVWGFGTVLRSELPAVAAGERFFGYYPMATRLLVSPGAVSDAGFSDTAAHRQPMAGLYNRYLRTSADPGYRVEDEVFLLLYRPLFGTAFFLDDLLVEKQNYGAESLVLSSASSKTAYSTAFLLSERKRRGAELEVVGLTSAANAAFVRKLGVYDRVVSYDEIDALPRKATVFLDFAGNPGVREAVHRRFSDALTHSAIIGFTHWQQRGASAEKLPGAEPELFFAPTWIKQRTAELTPSVVQARLARAWQSALEVLRDPKRGWLEVIEASGPAAVEKTYRDAAAGRMNPAQGQILSLNG